MPKPPVTKAQEDKLRGDADKATEKVADLRAQWKAKQTDAVGRKLVKAREEASEALAALWEAFPNEKPPTQYVL